MNSLRNRVSLIGNLGANPEIKEFGKDKKMARFSLATSETYKNDKGEKVTDTHWHNVVAWGKIAELAEQYLAKGNQIALVGKLVNRSWKDKEGATKYITEIIMKEMMMLKTK